MAELLPNDDDLALRVLKRARRLIARGWTKGPFAVNRRGKECSPVSSQACKWCASGAVERAIHAITGERINPLYFTVREYLTDAALNKNGYIALNEHARSVKPVLAMFDRAIANADRNKTALDVPK